MPKLAAGSAEQDILARLQKAEADLAALRKELDHSHQLATLGTLTAGIAHEINNILTPVLAYAQLAVANPHDSTLRGKALQRAISGVESAARITEAVLGFARQEDVDLHADLVEVIESTIACLGRDPERDGIDLLIEVHKGARVAIRPLALQQVLLNLMINALTAMAGRRGQLRIAAAEAVNDMTVIKVADTGPGVPPEVADRLFDPFVSSHPRKSADRKSRHGGSGLGLAICKRLVEGSGGTIVLDPPTPGSGAVFTITLPTAPPASSKAGSSEKAA